MERLYAIVSFCCIALCDAACGLGTAPADYGDPTSGATTTATLELELIDPPPFSDVAQVSLNASVFARHETGVVGLSFALNGGAWEHALPADDSDVFRAPMTLRWGINDLRLRAVAGDGSLRTVDVTLTYGGDAPTLVVTQPVHGGFVADTFAISGQVQALAPSTVGAVEARVGDGAWQTATVLPNGDFFTSLTGSGADMQQVSIRARDDQQRTSEVVKSVRRDAVAPSLELSEPNDVAIVHASNLEVRGNAVDDASLQRVEVQVDQKGWVLAALDETGSFTAVVELGYGENTVQARATDAAGNTATVSRRVFRARKVTLRPLTSLDTTTVTLTLNEQGLRELIPEADAASLDMLYLDLEGLIEEALKAMKDYTLYGVDTSAWGPAEWNMHKILTMSPDTADVSGTSLEEILTLSQNLGIPVPVVLGDLADISPTATFLTTEQLARGVMDNILASHPALVTDPTDGKKKIPISLGDAFADLVTLGDKLGPTDSHPGVLFDASPSAVLLPNFAMTVSARTNLRQHDAVDVSVGKTYLFARQPGEDILDFDFLDPDTFTVQGLADEPEVDLSFLITEHNGFVLAGTSQQGNATDGFERGDSPVWDLPTWTFEYLVADMMFEAYHAKFANTSFIRSFSYDVGSLTDAAVISWNRGWLEISTLGGVGAPPPPQYFWDSVLELAQVRLHDGGLSEGQGNLHLQIPGVRVPLSSAELIEATRPVLESQKSKMADIMVGDFSTYRSDADLFVHAGNDAELYLFFVTDFDVPGEQAPRLDPGLFSDPELTDKVSTTESLGSGDTTHEKVRISDDGGEVYFAKERDGTVWKITMFPRDGQDVVLTVEPGGAW